MEIEQVRSYQDVIGEILDSEQEQLILSQIHRAYEQASNKDDFLFAVVRELLHRTRHVLK